MVVSEIMGHHLHQHGVKRVCFVLNGPAIDADHPRHTERALGALVELIQAKETPCSGQVRTRRYRGQVRVLIHVRGHDS